MPRCQTGACRQVVVGQRICPFPPTPADWPSARRDRRLTWILAIAAAAVIAVLLAGIPARRARRHQRAVARLLDAADSLEDRLRAARSEIEAHTGGGGNPVREAMQEMLRHRLWLQRHGNEASIEQIDSVRSAIEDATRRIDDQLLELERARSPLH